MREELYMCVRWAERWLNLILDKTDFIKLILV